MTQGDQPIPNTRAEAIRMGATHYQTGKPCKRGHIALRTSPKGMCVDCDSENAKERWSAVKSDPSALAQHHERLRAYSPTHYANNKEAIAEQRRKFRADNPDMIKARNSAWAKANKELLAAKRARRRATLLQATPSWSNASAIALIYQQARVLSEETGIPHEVDHIYPLQGKTCCGLHVAENLRVIPRKLNRMKQNHHPEEFQCPPLS